MSKKAQGISISVVVVAVIALLVLVVLAVIFGGRMGLWSTELQNSTSKTCANDGGTVRDYGTCLGGERAVLTSYSDVKAGSTCCKTKTT